MTGCRRALDGLAMAGILFLAGMAQGVPFFELDPGHVVVLAQLGGQISQRRPFDGPLARVRDHRSDTTDRC